MTTLKILYCTEQYKHNQVRSKVIKPYLAQIKEVDDSYKFDKLTDKIASFEISKNQKKTNIAKEVKKLAKTQKLKLEALSSEDYFLKRIGFK